MDVRVCKRCKGMFQHVTGPDICLKCKQKEEETFQVVKEYLRKNPGASMNMVSRETEISIGTIEGFLRQGRLEVSPGSPISLSCERCGARILSGRTCSKCNSSLLGELTNAAKQIKEDNAPKKEEKKIEKMRFLRSDRIK